MLAALALLGSLAGPSRVSLVAVGDIMLGRDIGRKIDRLGVRTPFKLVETRLQSADIAFGNLECALTDRATVAQKPIRLRAKPGSALGLSAAGFDVLSLANNHSLDCGEAGLADAVAVLDGIGIKPLARFQSAVIERRGVKVGFYALVDLPGERLDVHGPWLAELDVLRRSCDSLVVSVHWGDEGSSIVSKRQREIARLLVDHGANLVLGHHPHVVQPVESVTTKPDRSAIVAYSLGNFVFDAPPGPGRSSILFCATLDKGGRCDWKTNPVQLVGGFPRLVSETDR